MKHSLDRGGIDGDEELYFLQRAPDLLRYVFQVC
jgi:hypothetical protein